MTPALESPSGNDHAEACGAPEVPEEIIAHLQTENTAQKETIATLLAANAALMAVHGGSPGHLVRFRAVLLLLCTI